MPRLLPGLLLASMVLAGCGTADDVAPGDKPAELLVVATTSILGDLVSQVVADDGRVEVLMGPGQDPHAFSPSARQAQLLREADLVVAVGLNLEEGMVDLLAAAEEDGVAVVPVAELLDPIAFGPDDHEDDEHEDDEHTDDEHGAFDPHVWLDPVRMAEGIRLIAARLAEIDATIDDAVLTARGDEVATAIDAAHDEVESTLGAIPQACRRIVTNHEALGYFAARYDLEVIGTVIPGSTTDVDPSAQAFADLARLLRDETIPAIFAENIGSTRLADALAGEIGRDVEVVELYTDALGGEGSGAETYVDLLRTNARLVADALADCGA